MARVRFDVRRGTTGDTRPTTVVMEIVDEIFNQIIYSFGAWTWSDACAICLLLCNYRLAAKPGLFMVSAINRIWLGHGLLLSPFKEVNVAIVMVSCRRDCGVVMVVSAMVSVSGFSGPILRCAGSMIRVLW